MCVDTHDQPENRGVHVRRGPPRSRCMAARGSSYVASSVFRLCRTRRSARGEAHPISSNSSIQSSSTA